MVVSDLVNINADLLAVGVAIAAIALLGFLIYLSDRKSVTNQAFLVFALITVVWGISNYLEYKFTTPETTLWALRTHLFISTFHALAFFTLAYVFPKEKMSFPRWYTLELLPLVGLTALLTLSPLVFSGIDHLAPAGQVTNPDRGPGIVLFSAVAFGLLIAGCYVLFRKWRAAEGLERRQTALIAVGMFLTAVLILLFNVFLPVTLNELGFIPLAALFLLPVIALTSYAIYRHHLFNLKVGAAGALVFVLAIANLGQITLSDNITVVIFALGTLVLVLIAGTLLIQSVLKEIALRETIEKQEQELEVANMQQVRLLHFISHEVKGYFTKAQGALAGIAEGNYGESCEPVQKLAASTLTEMRKGTDMVMDILAASDLKKGTVEFRKQQFDLRAAALGVVDSLRKEAEGKGLSLQTVFAPSGAYLMEGDEEKITKHVLQNLVENSIHYTPSGTIRISLSRSGAVLRFVVEDTGVGITPEDMAKLFTEGGRGKESQKINANSTGYGLFIAKQITEDHGGKIHAESEGTGKGSRFIVELPAAA